ncbi:hypothetical protein [Pseudonocardia sp. H11422]|uniref:hypothetical protein n=1 Tax=Pseudonocardia sp. H11422 TaxID=2835866 RepID=UPI001BDD4F32|nr:hypothetical protein [Pseudonocardia sp. H11422]
MSTTAAVVLSLAVAALLVAAFSKPTKTLVGGIFQRDRKGRMTLVLTPTSKPKRRRRRK